MKHDRQMALLDRMIALRRRREDRLGDTVLHQPLDAYTSREIFERELDSAVFRQPARGRAHRQRS